MNHDLIKEYVFLVLEKVRTTKKGSPFGNKFDVRKFKSLENINMMKAYADSFLSVLGEGSSRIAYSLTSGKVLKIALNEKGIAQNNTEMDVFTNPTTRPMISKIIDYDSDYRWIIADSVRAFNNESEFREETGIIFGEFVNNVKDAVNKIEAPDTTLAYNTVKTIQNTELLLGDIARVDHWGKSADGRVVLLDYGFTKEVWKKHYKSSTKEDLAMKSTEKAKTPSDKAQTRMMSLKTLKM
jgi:hypothetical protein